MRRLAVPFLATAFALVPARAQNNDQAYLRALVTVQAVGTLGTMVKDWCDERSPQTQDAHATNLSQWRKSVALDEIDARLAARKRAAPDSQAQRDRLYARMDEHYKKPGTVCGNLEKFLLTNFDPKQMYPAEYKLALAPQEAGAAKGSDAGSQPVDDAPAAKRAEPAADEKRSEPATKAAAPDTASAAKLGAEIPIAQLRAPAGKGLQTADIVGLLYHGWGVSTVSGYKYRDAVGPFLLKNGKAYKRVVPPEGIDIEKSQKLEPQMWGEWRKAGKGYELRWPDGAWQAVKGELQKPFAAGAKLNGIYENHNFEGSVGFGGMYFRRSYIFKSDGRIETRNFTQGSSGSLAALAGYSGSASTASDGKGTRSTSVAAGTDSQGGSPVTQAPSVVVTSESSKNDGAEHRGDYRASGYTLEVMLDSGRKLQVMAFPWGTERLWIAGLTYTLCKATEDC